MYDFANSGYTTVVITAVFNAYFVAVIAGNAPWATFAWTAVLSASYALILLTGPVIGAYADLRASKKRLLVLTTAGCVIATALLALTGTGIGLGLEPGLAGRALDSRSLPGLRHLGSSSRPGTATVCSGHDADHRCNLRRSEPADVLGAQGACPRGAGRRRRKPGARGLCAPRANAAPSRALSRPRSVPGMHRLLSSGTPDGHCARGDLRGTSARFHDEGYDCPDLGGQRDCRGRRVRFRQHPGSTRARANHCSYSSTVDRNHLDSLVRVGVRTFLGGRQSCRTVPGFLAVGRPGARWLPEPR